MKTFKDIVFQISLSFVNNGEKFEISDGIMRDFIDASNNITGKDPDGFALERNSACAALAYFIVGYLEGLRKAEGISESSYKQATQIMINGVSGYFVVGHN